MTRIVHLSVTTFGVTHWYGRVKWYVGRTMFEEDLEYPLNADQAGRLSTSDFLYEVGELTGRFWTQEAVYDRVRSWVDEQGDDVFVTEGTALNPGPVFACPDCPQKQRLIDIGSQAELWYQESDDPWFTFGEEIVESLWDEWRDLLEELDNER